MRDAMNISTTKDSETGSNPGERGFKASNACRYYVLNLLVAVGICSWVDRNVFSVPVCSDFEPGIY